MKNIDYFIRRMCVSYRRLNGITKPSELTITRCGDAIRKSGTGPNKILIISLYARQGYHQISVQNVDREKIAFFTPDNQKYTLLVMPLGPTNIPDLYSDIMKNFKDEWYMIFIETLHKIGTLINEQVAVTETDEVFIGDKNLISGIGTIIDDILLF